MTESIVKAGSSELLDIAADAELYDGNDGYSSSVGDKIRIARLGFNTKGLDTEGRAIPKDVYYNTASEQLMSQVDAVFCFVHSRRSYAEYDESANRYHQRCSSPDRVTGVMADDGLVRKCAGCPDAAWHKNAKGKPAKNCSEFHDVLAVDLANQEPFIITFKKTSERVIVDHLAKHHHNKLKVPGKPIAHIPIYWYQVRLTLRMHESGNYALPIIERRELVPKADIAMFRDTANGMREAMLEDMVEAAPDASFNPDEFAT